MKGDGDAKQVVRKIGSCEVCLGPLPGALPGTLWNGGQCSCIEKVSWSNLGQKKGQEESQAELGAFRGTWSPGAARQNFSSVVRGLVESGSWPGGVEPGSAGKCGQRKEPVCRPTCTHGRPCLPGNPGPHPAPGLDADPRHLGSSPAGRKSPVREGVCLHLPAPSHNPWLPVSLTTCSVHIC